MIPTVKPQLFVFAIFLIAGMACTQQNSTPSETTLMIHRDSTQAAASGVSIAFIYGDTVNARYKFLLDAEEELESEGRLIDDRIKRKYERAERRAAELQREAPSMGQLEMQEAQIELQNLQIEIQEFQEKLARDFRKREVELQREYLARVNAFLEKYNAEGRYDVILNFQPGGNLLWVSSSFDITDDVIQGLNNAYAEELATKGANTSKK